MTAAIALGDGRFTVPGNRWDLLAHLPTRRVPVAVIIPYYNQQSELDLVLAALNAQDYPAELLHIVVADDGSAEAPLLPAMRASTDVVRQEDNGFRAAAARNLGAAGVVADVLCFLDADTIPQPDYIRRIVSLPTVCPDALVVGRRRHADFTRWTPQRVRRWQAGGDPPEVLDEPRWLSDEYAASGDLLELNATSYRYIISSVMCCSSMLFNQIGGFDETFQQYGGEDWDFAHRAMIGGAVLRHARDAVAWHQGPDWGAREVADRAAVKNQETMAVAQLVPDSELRVHGMVYRFPAVAVEIDADGHGPGSLLATIGCFLHLDVGVWVHGPQANELLANLRLTDPRIRDGAIPSEILRRCRHVISVTGRAVVPRAAVVDLVQRGSRSGMAALRADEGCVGIACVASWARSRAQRWRQDLGCFGEIAKMNPQAMGLLAVAADHAG